MTFSSFGLADKILRAVDERGYDQPTPIQSQAIPAVLSGGDLLAGAQTGTGKTAGFVLPILHRLTHNEQSTARQYPRALILAPTRELAAQVEDGVREYGRYLDLESLAVFGGVNIRPQMRRLRTGVDILVATPGRLLDHHQQGTVDLSRIEILVLDEADRMLDMGFIRDIRKILNLLPQTRQNLLFSATFSTEIKSLADQLLNQPQVIEVPRCDATASRISQRVIPVDRQNKRALLTHLIKQHNWQQVLVFTRTKHRANRLAQQLQKARVPALAIHGNKTQSARTRALAEFKQGNVQVLVATDIAARGIDITDLPHVVNYELPNIAEDYIHRIGRTGRAGSSGEAVSLVCGEEKKLLEGIEKLLQQKLPKVEEPGFEPDPSIRPQPSTEKHGLRNRSHNNQNPVSRGSRSTNKQGPKTRSAGPGRQRKRRYRKAA
ncbi:MAG: DEAD/DEAH box helicase [Xanthomonadales bacterium]|nr:DEAD/DEAH box helicase [Xanthomonadales bacterium]